MLRINVAPGFTVNDDSKALGIIQGWNMFEAALQAAGEPIEPIVPLKATFAPPEEDLQPDATQPKVSRKRKR